MSERHYGDRVQRGGFWDRSNVKPDTDHIRNPRRREQEIVKILDDIGFNWKVFIAVSAGFLASSYIIFSSNVIETALQYVYPAGPDDISEAGLTIDMVTIGTTALGMLVFGHLADRLGRKRLYGLELFTIVIGTVGMVQSSPGYTSSDGNHSLNVYAATAAWRGIQGLGYPLSAIIAAEFSSTQTRGTLIASMFAMQSAGRVCAYLAALFAIAVLDHTEDPRTAIDRMWRLVVGIGAVPALLAIGLRLTIPETPRYYTGIERDLKKAVQSIKKVGGRDTDLDSIHSDIQPTGKSRDDTPTPWLSTARNYLFGHEKGWRRLAGISLIWLLLDLSFYGLGLDSPSTLDRLWLNHTPPSIVNCTSVETIPAQATRFMPATLTLDGGAVTTLTQAIVTPVVTASPTLTAVATTTVTTAVAANPAWNPDPGHRCETINQSLKVTAIRTLLLSSIASVAGSVLAIPMVNYFSRRNLLAATSAILSIFFFVSAFGVWKTTDKPTTVVSMVFFALSQFIFNLGPNTLIFIIAAESFPTVFRGTFYGFAAASGKCGALIIRPIMHVVGNGKMAFVGVLFGFFGAALLMTAIALTPGAIVDAQFPRNGRENRRGSLSKAEIDKVSRLPKRLKNKTLEQIAPNPENWLAGQSQDGGADSPLDAAYKGGQFGTRDDEIPMV